MKIIKIILFSLLFDGGFKVCDGVFAAGIVGRMYRDMGKVLKGKEIGIYDTRGEGVSDVKNNLKK